MIEINTAFDERGILRSCNVTGHAESGPQGSDIVCAAVSILTRTALRVLASRDGIRLQGGAPERGVFWMEMDYTVEGKDFLSAIGTFLKEGFESISRDYPNCCKMNIYTEWRS